MKSRRDWIVLAFTAMGPVLLFGPMLLRGRVLYWGTPIMQFVPWHEYALGVLREGYLPFWNPLLGFGAPLFANYQSALLYPPNLLLAAFGPAYGHGLLAALHLIWAGTGMVFLSRRLDLPPRSQIVAGLAFSLSGYIVARAWFISINHAAAWLPWIILGADRLVETSISDLRDRRWIDIVLLGVLFSMQWLAGHAQTSWYTLLFAIAWVVWRILQGSNRRQMLRSGFDMFLAGLLGLLLSAVQLIPTIEYFFQSQRVLGMDQEFALTYSFWPWRLVGLVAPDLFGSPVTGTYWGYGNYWEDAIFIGVFPFLMVISLIPSLFRMGKSERGIQVFLFGTSMVSFLFALGKNTFIFRFLYEYVPTFNLFQAPARWNLLVVFCLALLAGFGIQHWRTPEGKVLYWTRLGTAGAGIVGIASYIGARFLVDVQATFVPAFARAGLLLFISGMLTLFLNKDRQWGLLITIATLVTVDMVSAGFGLNPAGEREVFQGQSGLAEIVTGSQRVYMPSSLEEQLKFEKTHRFDTFFPGIDWRAVRDVGLPNTTMLDGVYSVNNFDPFTPGRYARWMQWLESLPEGQQDNILRWVDVRWRAELSEEGVLGVAYKELAPGSKVWMIPKAAAVTNGEEALSQLSDPAFDYQEVVLIEMQIDPRSGGSNGETAIIPQSNPNQVSVRASTDKGSWLLLSETWYPGWQVTVDGGEAELYRANYLFMAVWVPRGEHTVDFRYRPTWIGPTVLLTGVGWLSVALYWLKARKQ